MAPPTAVVSPSADTLASILLAITLIAGTIGLAVRAAGTIRPSGVPALWLIGGAILFAAMAYMRMAWVPPHHAMYVDEPWYMEAARNLSRRGALVLCQGSSDGTSCVPYEKAAGWPVVLGGAFALFGSGSAVAFALSGILAALAVVLAGVVTRLAGGAWHQAIFAALLLAIHPLHVSWSATAETNAASTAILLAGVVGVLLVLHRPSLAGALVAAGGLGLAAAMRPELAMVLVPVLVVLIFARGDTTWRDALIIAIGGALGSTSVAASWPLYIANSSGTFLSPDNLGPNFARLLGNDEGGPVTILILLLAVAGALVSVRRRAFDVVAILGGGAVLTALVAIGYDRRIFYPRTVLGSLVLLAPLAALALPGRRGSAVAACLLGVALAIPGLRHVAQVTDTQLLETRLPVAIARAALPANAVVIAEWPTVLAAETDVIAFAAKDLAAHDNQTFDGLALAIEKQPHLLLCDMFCEPGFADGGTPPVCARILSQFEVEEVTAVFDERRRYGLYRLIRRAGPGGTHPVCPFPVGP